MNRRDFLKAAGIGGAAVALGSLAYRVGFWWDQPAGSSYGVLSELEGKITAGIADALFPGDVGNPPLPNGVEAGVVEEFDRFLGEIPDKPADMLRVVLHAIDDMAIASDLSFTRFHNRSREERTEIVRAWDHSDILVRRAAFRGVKFTLASSYCDHPDVLQAMGIQYTCGGVG